MIHLEDGPAVGVGDGGQDGAGVAGIGGIFYKAAGGSAEEFKIGGVTDEEVLGPGQRFHEGFAIVVVGGGPGDQVISHGQR